MRGQSLQSRVFAVEFSRGVVKKDRVTECQQDAARGLYAASLAGFVRWLAPRYGEALAGLRQERAAIRARAEKEGQHARTPDIVANLALGLRYLLDFAAYVGAVTDEECKALKRRGWAALLEDAEGQAAHLAAAEPGGQFVRLLAAAVASGPAFPPGRLIGRRAVRRRGVGLAHAGKDGRGSRRRHAARPAHRVAGRREHPSRPGRRLCRGQPAGCGTGRGSLPVGQRTLWKRLHGARADPDGQPGRGRAMRYTWRRTLEGHQRDVLLMRQDALFRPAGDGAAVDTPAKESAHLDTSGECPPEKHGATKGYDGNGHFGHLSTNKRAETTPAHHDSDTNEGFIDWNNV